MYIETGAIFTQGLRTLFKDAIARANQSCINEQILKSFQKYPEVLTKYGKNYNEFLQELKNYLSSK